MPYIVLVLAVFVALAFYLDRDASDQDIDPDGVNDIDSPTNHLIQ
jgi:hypothetical protein